MRGNYLKFVDNIEGVEVRDLKINVDDRGTLIEAVRIDWPEVQKAINFTIGDQIEQIYIVENHEESIRAYHKHEHLVDIFCILRGVAKFVLVDDRVENRVNDKYGPYYPCKIINVCGRKPQIITVPTGVYHGWKGSKDCLLLSVANKLYKGKDYKDSLDEDRISWNYFGSEIWDTQFK